MKSYRHYLKRFLARLTLGTIVTIAVPLLVVILWLRFFGLPEVAKVYLLAEIQRRHILPFPISVDRLLLDPTGAVLADASDGFSRRQSPERHAAGRPGAGQFCVAELVARQRADRQREHLERRCQLSGRAGGDGRFSRGECRRRF